MTASENLAVARRLSDLADRLYADGDDVAAAEMWWGAVNRIITALALRHGLTAGHQQPRRGQVIHHLVSSHQAGTTLHDKLGAAGALHGHFYNSHLTPNGLAIRVAETRVFIADLIGLYDQVGAW